MSLSGGLSDIHIDTKCEKLNYSSSSSLNTTPGYDEPESDRKIVLQPELPPCHIVLDKLSVPITHSSDLPNDDTADSASPVIKGVYSLSGTATATVSSGASSTGVKSEWLERPLCSSSPIPPPAPAALQKSTPSVNKVIRKRKQSTPCKRKKRKREEELDATYSPKGRRRPKVKTTSRTAVSSTTSPVVSASRPRGRPRKYPKNCLAPVREKWVLSSTTTTASPSISSTTTTIATSLKSYTVPSVSASPSTVAMEETSSASKVTVISLPMTSDVAARLARTSVSGTASSLNASISSSTITAPSCSSPNSAATLRSISPVSNTTVCELCGKEVQLPRGAKFTSLCPWCENARQPPVTSASQPTSSTSPPTTSSASQSPDSATRPSVSAAPPTTHVFTARVITAFGSCSWCKRNANISVNDRLCLSCLRRRKETTVSSSPLLCIRCGKREASNAIIPLCTACRLSGTTTSAPAKTTNPPSHQPSGQSAPTTSSSVCLRRVEDEARANAQQVAENAAAVLPAASSMNASHDATTISPLGPQRQPAAFYQHPPPQQNMGFGASTQVVSSLPRPVR